MALYTLLTTVWLYWKYGVYNPLPRGGADLLDRAKLLLRRDQYQENDLSERALVDRPAESMGYHNEWQRNPDMPDSDMIERDQY